MKKILIITNHSYMLYQFRKELIEKLMETHEVVLSMPFVGHEDDFCKMGCKCINTDVDRRGVNPVSDFKLLCKYIKILKNEKPDMVVTYSIKPNIYGSLACRFRKIVYCANVQGLGSAFQKRGLVNLVTVLYKIAFRNVKTVFFENEDNAAEFQRRKIVPAYKQIVLHGAGVNLEHYTYTEYPDTKQIRFLFVGRIMKEKGIDELFLAMERLKNEYGDKVGLDIIGFFEDEYSEKVEKLQKDGIAVFHGFHQEIRPFYALAHCVVLPSYHEGMSNMLLEAAACGRPVITSDIPGCREAVEEGVTGYLCKARDADSLYSKMKMVTDLNVAQRAEMGIRAREKMKREFEKEEVVSKTVKTVLEV